MFRDKSFLKHNFQLNRITIGEEYVLGTLYDEFVQDNVVYLDLNRINEEVKRVNTDYKNIPLCKGRAIPHTSADAIIEDFFLIRFIPKVICPFEIDKGKYPKAYNRMKLMENNRKRQVEKKSSQKGIYGIYVDDELVYIGKTNRSFEERFNEHKDNIDKVDIKLYRNLRIAKEQNRKIDFRILIDITNINTKDKPNKKFTNEELCDMELALIQVLKPKYNVEGVSLPYRYC